MSEISKESFINTLNVLIDANPHARSKGDVFKDWVKSHFGCDARISFIKEQRQITNRVSEQFRYFSPVVVFVCVGEVKRETLIKYILERIYSQLACVAIIGYDSLSAEKYSFENLVVFKDCPFSNWATQYFENILDKKDLVVSGNSQQISSDDCDIDFAWYVGATGNDENGIYTDFSEQYISEGKWENRYDVKYTEIVKTIAVGDRIVIKSSYTKKHGLPFENKGKTVSVMGIKAIGIVTKNYGDGKLLDVEWQKVDPIKEWFGDGVLRATVHCVRATDSYIKKALLMFTFNDMQQDLSIYDESDDSAEVSEELLPNDLPVRTARNSSDLPLNTILYGAPGTGKTYSTAEYAMAILQNRILDLTSKSDAERAALMSEYRELVKSGRIVFTTFHQSYGYEDFIQGLRPDNNVEGLKFVSVDGVFKRIADKAMFDTSNNYVIIIDEINRANISKVFGELITLIEEDKRWGEINQLSVVLPSGDEFAVPNNLYIIGTMNSADKSISLIDTALRRRFEFVEVTPNYDLVDDVVLKNILKALNDGLVRDLDSTDLLIGHAYFIGKTEADLCNIMNRNIIPLLYEYYFDNSKKVKNLVEEAIRGLNYTVKGEDVGRLKFAKKD